MAQVVHNMSGKAEPYGADLRMHRPQTVVALHPTVSKKGAMGNSDVHHFPERGAELLGP